MAESPRRYELLVFDWDGTLADSTALIAGAIQQACRDMGLAVPDDTTARHVIGLGQRDSIHHVAPALDPRQHTQFTERFGAHYMLGDAAIPLFAGVPDMLAELASLLTAVARVEQHTDAAAIHKSRGMFAKFVASPTSLDADHAYRRLVEKRVKQPDCVRPAADARD